MMTFFLAVEYIVLWMAVLKCGPSISSQIDGYLLGHSEAQVRTRTLTDYKDERLAGWTLNLLSVLLIPDPNGDLTNHDPIAFHEADTET
jgi:hypothetical protein